MRTLSRTVASIAAAFVVSVALALPASAGQLIRYRGETSAPSYNRVKAHVVKRDSGRRVLEYIAINFTLTCEDATTQEVIAFIGIGRLAEDGSFAREINRSGRGLYVRVDGTIGFRDGNGTFLFNLARLTEDGSDAQLCTTGELTWTVERTNAEPAKWAVDIPGGNGLLRVSVSDGDHEVVKLMEQ
ncbi:MAG TPA: hypothetical protein VFI59_15700 [Actinomycetota bacterium]|nr:hypothetical protein [Actinomycetota bacterium]